MSYPATDPESMLALVQELAGTAAYFHSRGWCLGTSGNYSVVLNPNPARILITASGKDKGRLTPDDFVAINELAEVTGEFGAAYGPHRGEKPSAETHLHIVLAQEVGAGSILHTHSVHGTLLSDHYFSQGGFSIQHYEMLKGLAGITTHETTKRVEIFENTQDIPALAEIVRERLHDEANPLKHGFLIRNHGLYAWGANLAEARRHIEIFEFLFEVLVRKMSLPSL
jgi:methylthioribulose-1-phosphate dehydratase